MTKPAEQPEKKPARKLMSLSADLQAMAEIDRIMTALPLDLHERVMSWINNKFAPNRQPVSGGMTLRELNGIPSL